MSISTQAEHWMPLREAVTFYYGNSPEQSTIIRWAVRGVKGVRLAAKRRGSRWFTTVRAVEEFQSAIDRQAAGVQS